MTEGLWPQIRAGSPPAVTAAIRVSERRARLLGLDEPVLTKTEVTGSLSVSAQARLNAEKEELQCLDLDELEALAAASDRLVADAIASSKARRAPRLVAAATLPALDVAVVPSEPTEPPVVPAVSNEREP
jgi:hypothetical protein